METLNTIENNTKSRLTIEDLARSLIELSRARRGRYAMQMNVSCVNELSDEQLKNFIKGGSIYVTGTDSEMNDFSERLERLGLQYK